MAAAEQWVKKRDVLFVLREQDDNDRRRRHGRHEQREAGATNEADVASWFVARRVGQILRKRNLGLQDRGARVQVQPYRHRGGHRHTSIESR